MKKILLPLLSGCFLSCSETISSGTTDETMSGNKSAARVYNPDGTPAIGATVKVFQYGSTSLVLKTETDSSGHYSVAGLNGTYSILFKKDTLAAFQDSAFIFLDTNYIKSDTLKMQSKLSAQIGLQPGDNYQTVTVEVLGTDIFANVDAKGKFELLGLGEGKYRFRLSSTLPNYTTTYHSESVARNASINLKDTLWLIYTGIPTVKGLSASYDTLSGVMSISWKSADYPNFQEYLLYKQENTSKSLPTVPLAILADTIYKDTIYPLTKRFADTNSYSFQYRVKIRDKFDKEGSVYGFLRGNAYPPSLVKTYMTFNSLSKIDTLTRNDTIRIALKLENKTRRLKTLKWSVGKIDSAVKSVDLDSTTRFANDTLSYSWPSEGTFKVYATNRDNAGTSWVDSFQVYVIKDVPRINAQYDTLVLTNSEAKLHATAAYRFSKIAKWEWDIGNTGHFTQVSNGDTSIIVPDNEQSRYLCILKATNEDGWFALDTMTIQSQKIITISPNFNTFLSGKINVMGVSDTAISKIEVNIADRGWVTATGVKSWSVELDSRILYPLSSTTIRIRATQNGVILPETEIPVRLSNEDPLNGCWGRTPGDTYPQCFYPASCSSNWISDFANYWSRLPDGRLIIYGSRDNFTFVTNFSDYNTLNISKSNYADGTWIRQ
ncbi:MAG: carboxypeptidase regulatory-like domain-containing protein [Fibrobacteres bacterium]|nr:carboxypeptidase regulatory-like domain-containing protein [Fibrobacterota bacterium]